MTGRRSGSERRPAELDRTKAETIFVKTRLVLKWNLKEGLQTTDPA